MDRFTLAEFAKYSENKEDASFTPQVQEAGIEQGALIVSRLYNTMLGEITKTMKSWDAELAKVLEEGGITPSAATNEQLYNAILRIINRTHGRNIGDVYYSQSNLAADNPGALPLFTGELVSNASNAFPEFCTWLAAHSNLCITQAQYDTRMLQYGECPFYVYNIGADTIRLPKLVNYIKMANSTDKITQTSAGLPNITGTFAGNDNMHATGAFSIGGPNHGGQYKGNISVRDYDFSASSSNSMYGKSNTVTPAHTTLFPWVTVYNVARPASEAQAAEFIGSLSGKSDIDLGNVNSSGSSKSAGWAFPSSVYEDLTLGASGTTYTAPANGYFVFHFSNSGLTDHWVNIVINDVFIGNWWAQVANNTFAIPEYMVRKGDTFKIEYGSDITGAWIARFYYAEGSKSEAN